VADRPELIAALPPLDWRQPWFAPWAGIGEVAQQAVQAGAPVHAALPAAPGVPRFVTAASLPAGMPYESFVYAEGAVPTRDNLHDFLNGIVWCAYPLAKQRLNRLQAEAIARDGIGARRGPLRDAITLFDENGAVFSAPAPLRTALQARDWQALFLTHRGLWAQARLWLFGHALAEKLAAPRKDITAHVLVAPQGLLQPAQVDAWMAATLDAAALAAKPFSPLPVLGVPGWWPANAAPDFYADATVFRPRRPTAMPRS